jgi:hypothetical protein
MYEFLNSENKALGVFIYDSLDTSDTTWEYNLAYSSATASPVRVLGTSYTVNAAPLTGANNIGSAPTFTDYAGGDYSLTSGSAGHNAASDGTDMGANMTLVGVQ